MTQVVLADVVTAAVKSVIVFAILILLVIMLIWAERKIIADMQSRIGPNRAGPFGLLQTLADGIKLIMKEDILPTRADRIVYTLAPLASVLPAFLAFAVVPFGDTAHVLGRDVSFQLADLNVGVLFFLAMGSLSVYGIALAGWSSGSKYPLLGAVRSSAQMISYEVALGLSVVPVVLFAGTLSTRGIVEAQQGRWFIIFQIPAFVMFMLAAIAETNRAPFDLPEAETELVAGYHTEYSGAKFLMFFLAEYVHVVTVSAMAVTMFWGGWLGLGPTPSFLPWIWPLAWFVAKVAVFIFFFFWLRASMPRLRYDQLMTIGWKYMIPFGIVWIPLSAATQLLPTRRWFFILVSAIIGVLLLSGFFPTRRREPREVAEAAS
jgi:NADH-quinone oxidoreductase subunit H